MNQKINKVYVHPTLPKVHFDAVWKGYLMFEDSWLSAYKYVQDHEDKELYRVLDNQIFEDYVMEGDHGATISQRLIKRSLIKLDRPTSGTMFVGINSKLLD